MANPAGKPSDLAEELLADLADTIADRLAKSGHAEDAAQALGEEIALDMAERWGGQQIYFTKGRFSLVSRRHQEMYAAFHGNNINEVAARFGVGVPALYKIFKRVRKAELARIQGSLFQDEGQAA